ncbi:EAL domain-containing protein [Paenibacillaceae bacterium WGS1546]|uniref:EAL domain-containing protein n=1 Tax=Cohnella sp. WGS1546 TaxID=3366810 RepID=UPI00372D1864
MARYHRASAAAPIRDAGLVEFAADIGDIREELRETIADFEGSSVDQPLAVRYRDEREFLRLLSALQRTISPLRAERVQCRIAYEPEEEDSGAERDGDDREGWVALSDLYGEIGGTSVPDYILHRNYTIHLQPVVRSDGATIGYEMLARPMPEQAPFRPAELFAAARKIGQHAFLDRAARHSAIRMGASHLRQGMKRFVNFLPSSLHRPDACLQCTFDAIKQSGASPSDYVFEVIESEPLDDPAMSSVFDACRREGILLALDDVGKGFATLDVVERLKPDYVKMDRRWVARCENDAEKQRYIDRLIERVSRFGGIVLAEGVERAEEWHYLKQAGVPLFQGYLFGRAVPVPAAPVLAR